jgi:signal peptidase I
MTGHSSLEPHSLSTLDEQAAPISSRHLPTEANVTEQMPSRAAANDRPFPSPRTSASRLNQGKSLLWEVAQTVLLTVAIFLAVRLVVQNFRVEGASMDPTLRSGQFLLINKVTYARVDGTPLEAVVPSSNRRASTHYLFGGPSRGDIVVFRSPTSSDKDFIKRVIGLPGETVKIQDGRVFINGTELAEPYVTHRATYDVDSKRVPSDSFFVLGDNRPNSSDSHLSGFGSISADSIIGRAWVSYWPPNRWGVVDSAVYAGLD